LAVTEWLSHNLIHVGAILEIICFTFRNQIALRAFSIASGVAFVGYYFLVTDRPLWEAMAWEGGSIIVNVVMIAIILTEKRLPRLTTDELLLFQRLEGLTVEQFMRLVRIAKWQSPTAPLRLTQEDEMPSELHYVLEGEIEIDKAGRQFKVPTAAFVGELAYLRGKPATATFTVMPGAKLVSWSHDTLRRAVMKEAELQAALSTLLNKDLAEKVARS
jgi:hypothetical protein